MAFSVPPPCFCRLDYRDKSPRQRRLASPSNSNIPVKSPDGTEAECGNRIGCSGAEQWTQPLSHAGWLGAEGVCCVVSFRLKSCRRQRPCRVQSGVGHCEFFPPPTPFFFFWRASLLLSFSPPLPLKKRGDRRRRR